MKIEREQLLEILPHRPPILMLDEVEDLVPGEKGNGLRYFPPDDPVFDGHFPDQPILPGVLTIEAFAQAALIVAILEDVGRDVDARNGRLAKCQEITFLEPVYPEMTVTFCVEIERRVAAFIFVDCKAISGESTIATGKLVLKM